LVLYEKNKSENLSNAELEKNDVSQTIEYYLNELCDKVDENDKLNATGNDKVSAVNFSTSDSILEEIMTNKIVKELLDSMITAVAENQTDAEKEISKLLQELLAEVEQRTLLNELQKQKLQLQQGSSSVLQQKSESSIESFTKSNKFAN
jgi:hypothetical protein